MYSREELKKINEDAIYMNQSFGFDHLNPYQISGSKSKEEQKDNPLKHYNSHSFLPNVQSNLNEKNGSYSTLVRRNQHQK